MKRFLFALPFLLVLTLVIIIAGSLLRPTSSDQHPSPLIGQTLPDFSIPKLGSAPAAFSPRNWRGQVTIVNIFASWCEACQGEHPLLMELSKQEQLNLVGIAWKDSATNIKSYLKQAGSPYSSVGIDAAGDTTLVFGLTGVPETYLLDRDNIVRWKWSGPLTPEIVTQQLLPELVKLHAL